MSKSKVNPQKLSAIHQQLSNLKIDLLDTKIMISKQQVAASKFTINIAKQLFKFIDQYKQKQFSQLLEISQCSKRLVDQVLAYKGIHIEQNNLIEFLQHTLPLIDDIFEVITKELLLLQVKIKDIAVSSAFSQDIQGKDSKAMFDHKQVLVITSLNQFSQVNQNSNHHQLLQNSASLQKVLGLISTESRKRDKDFVLELIKRQFQVKDGSKQGQFSLKRHCHNMTITQMERYVCSLINNSYNKNLPGLPTKSNNINQSKIRYKNDVSLDDILAISNSKVPLTLRLKDWEQASAFADSSQSTVIDVKSVVTGTKSILKLFEQTPVPAEDATGSQNNKMMFINSNGVEIPYDPKKIKKIQFSGSFKKAKADYSNSIQSPQIKSKRDKDLPFTHTQIDKLVFAQDDTMQLSKAMQDRRIKLLEENDNLSQIQRDQMMEQSFTVSTSVTGKNVDGLCDKSLASDIQKKFQKFPPDIYANSERNEDKKIIKKQQKALTPLQNIKSKKRLKQSSSSSFITNNGHIDNSFRQKYQHNELQRVQRIETPIRLRNNGSQEGDGDEDQMQTIGSRDNSNTMKANSKMKAGGKIQNNKKNKQLITIESLKQTSLSSSINNNKISISSRKILTNNARHSLKNNGSGKKYLKSSNSKFHHKTFESISSQSSSSILASNIKKQKLSFQSGQTKNKIFNYQMAEFSSSNQDKNLRQNKILSKFDNSVQVRDKDDLYVSNIQDDDEENDQIFERELKNKPHQELLNDEAQQSKKSFDLFSSRNKANSALGFNSEMMARSSNGESKASPRKGKGVLKSIMHQQGRTTAATSISQQQLPPIESHRALSMRDKNLTPQQYNPTRVVLERKLRKIIELQNMSVPQSPKQKLESVSMQNNQNGLMMNSKKKKGVVIHPIGYQSERVMAFPSSRSSVVGIKAGPEIKSQHQKLQKQHKMKQVRVKTKKI